MDPQRWQRINETFHEALARPRAEWEALLEERCGDDEPLRAEVRSLLQAHDESSVLDHPAYEVAPALLGESVEDPLLGQQVGPYRVLSTLGRGGMGVVYLGEDTRLRRPVAIKALPTDLTENEHFRARLHQEALTTAVLSHRGIATVYALEEIEGRSYLVREFVDGQTLREVAAQGPLPLETILDLALEVTRALQAAHAGGVIHRDLKPENVMRTTRGAVKVLDFGLARFEQREGAPERTDDRLTRQGGAIGTPGYMAPEQLRGDAVDTRTDLFSLGVVLYELITGAHPFEAGDATATMARVLSAEPAALTERRPDCPPALVEIVTRCLAKAPDDRFENTGALVAALGSARGLFDRRLTPATSALAAPAPGPAPAPTNLLRRWQRYQIAISGLFATTLVPLWFVRDSLVGSWENAPFLAGVAAVGWACHLRLHLLFTSRVFPTGLADERRRTVQHRFWADLGFTVVLVVSAFLTRERPLLASVFLMMAVSVGALGRILEPAAARAAFPRDPG